MDKSVVFDFVGGSFEEGFVVMWRIEEDGNRPLAVGRGNLPEAPEIPQHYSRWQDIYFNLGLSLGLPFRLEAPAAQVTNYSIQECNNAAKVLRHSLNTWLRSELFLSVRERVLTVLASIRENDEVRVFIKSENLLLQRLPWHLWDLFENFPKAEIALFPLDDVAATQASTPRSKVNILAIFGSSQGINTQEDRDSLRQLPNAEVTFLVNPRRYELNDQLWAQNWPILFFAGHSSSQDQGRIYINETESLTIDDLNYAMRTALANGLKLAIFNSCDGLRLARALAHLHIPVVIVMREPVPDQVAQAFLRYFLQAFARGKSAYLAVREARERLQGLEDQYPCATWLPIICQNPCEKPPAWSDLFYRPRRSNRVHIGIAIGLAFLAAAVILTVVKRPTSPPPTGQLFQTSMGEEILITADTTSDKEAGVKAFAAGNFATAVNKLESSLKVKPNDPEALIYLNNARAAQKSHPFKIAVVGPIGSNRDIAQEILRGVAQAQNEFNRSGGLNGRLLQVEIGNDSNDPDLAKQLANKFVEDRSILAVVGHNASEASLAAAPVYEKSGLVMISPTSGATDLSEKGSYIFRTVPTDRVDAKNLAHYAIKTAQKTKIAICTDSKSPYSQSLKEEFKKAVHEENGKVSGVTCDFSADKFNHHTVMDKFMRDGADGLLLLPSVERIQQATNMAKTNKGRLELLSGSTMYTFETLKGQKDVNGMVLSVVWHPTQFPENPFSANASKLWDRAKVNWRTAMAYDATQVIIAALERSNTRQELQVRQELQKVLSSPGFSVNGATGKIEFLKSGDRDGQSILVQVQPSGTGYDFVRLNP